MKTAKLKSTKTKVIQIRPYNPKGLMKALGISTEEEFHKLTEPIKLQIGLRFGDYYSPRQVDLIYKEFIKVKKAA